jgi:outer membrane protein with beta-barrel domain
MRISIALFLLLSFSRTAIAQETTTAAQENTATQIKLGFEAGPDISRLNNAYFSYTSNSQLAPFDSKSRTGVAGGVFADILMADMFTFRAKILYTMGGGNLPAYLNFYGNVLAPATNISMQYINVPLQFLYSPSLSFGRPWIGIGFYTSMMLSGTAKSDEGSKSLSLGGHSSDDYQRWDFGFNPSAGLTLKNGLMFGVDYQAGMVKLSTDPPGGYGPRLNTRTSIWSFHVGYEWKLKLRTSVDE